MRCCSLLDGVVSLLCRTPRLLIFYVLLSSFGASAFVIDEKLPSSVLEARAIKIFKITRCMVCSGETLHESQSAFAFEMRSLIRQNILQGMTDEEIIEDLKRRYGIQILNTTPRDRYTYFLWIFPVFVALVIIAGMIVKFSFVRRNTLN